MGQVTQGSGKGWDWPLATGAVWASNARQGEHSELWGARMTLDDYRAHPPG